MNLKKKLSLKVIAASDRFLSARIDLNKCLLINGFWRSATTWIQEVISHITGAKAVFEALQVRSGYLYRCLNEINPPRRDYGYLGALMPYDDSAFKNKVHLSFVFERSLMPGSFIT